MHTASHDGNDRDALPRSSWAPRRREERGARSGERGASKRSSTRFHSKRSIRRPRSQRRLEGFRDDTPGIQGPRGGPLPASHAASRRTRDSVQTKWGRSCVRRGNPAFRTRRPLEPARAQTHGAATRGARRDSAGYHARPTSRQALDTTLQRALVPARNALREPRSRARVRDRPLEGAVNLPPLLATLWRTRLRPALTPAAPGDTREAIAASRQHHYSQRGHARDLSEHPSERRQCNEDVPGHDRP